MGTSQKWDSDDGLCPNYIGNVKPYTWDEKAGNIFTGSPQRLWRKNT